MNKRRLPFRGIAELVQLSRSTETLHKHLGNMSYSASINQFEPPSPIHLDPAIAE